MDGRNGHPVEILTRGDRIYKQDEPVTTAFALYFAPDGDGALILGSRDELVAMLDNATATTSRARAGHQRLTQPP